MSLMQSDPEADALAASLEGRRIRAELEARLFGEPQEFPRVDHYVIQHKLGQGGMGTVYAALDARSGQRVAIKVVEAKHTLGVQRLRREAKAMASLNHPNIVAVHDVGEYDDGLYLVMDLVEGETLRAWAGDGRPWEDVVALGLQVADALVAAHTRGLLHRDVKPDNIIVDNQGQARLLDFGFAKLLPDSSREGLSQFNKVLTCTGEVLGTLGYMAPEQLLGMPVGPSCDQFSLCATLFESLFGVSPFVGKTEDAVALAIVTGVVSAVPEDTTVPDRVVAVVKHGMATFCQDRFSSMDEFAKALRTATNEPAPSRSRTWWGR